MMRGSRAYALVDFVGMPHGDTIDDDQRRVAAAISKKDATVKSFKSQLDNVEDQKRNLQSEVRMLRHELSEHMNILPVQEDQIRVKSEQV